MRAGDVYGFRRISVELEVQEQGSVLRDERALVSLRNAESNGLHGCHQLIGSAQAAGHRIDAKLTWFLVSEEVVIAALAIRANDGVALWQPYEAERRVHLREDRLRIALGFHVLEGEEKDDDPNEEQETADHCANNEEEDP
jgi:hypothetical protein